MDPNAKPFPRKVSRLTALWVVLFILAVAWVAWYLLFGSATTAHAAETDAKPRVQVKEFTNDPHFQGSIAEAVSGIISTVAETTSLNPEFVVEGEVSDAVVVQFPDGKLAQITITSWLTDSTVGRKYLMVSIGSATGQDSSTDTLLLEQATSAACRKLADKIINTLALIRAKVVAVGKPITLNRGKDDGVALGMQYRATRGDGLSDWKIQITRIDPENNHLSYASPVSTSKIDIKAGEQLALWREKSTSDDQASAPTPPLTVTSGWTRRDSIFVGIFAVAVLSFTGVFIWSMETLHRAGVILYW